MFNCNKLNASILNPNRYFLFTISKKSVFFGGVIALLILLLRATNDENAFKNTMELNPFPTANQKNHSYAFASTNTAFTLSQLTNSEQELQQEENNQIKTKMLKLIPNGTPMVYSHLTSKYGPRIHPVTGKPRFHHGIDLEAKIGTPIYSSADGVIEYKYTKKDHGYGYALKIKHAFGFETIYAHLDRFNVSLGQFVEKGKLIGWSGNTGLSTGPHLHYEIRFLNDSLNPKNFINWSKDNFDQLFQNEKNIQWNELILAVKNRIDNNYAFYEQKSKNNI